MWFDDTYIRYIYTWLQNSGLDVVETQLVELMGSLTNLIDVARYALMALCFFGLLLFVTNVVSKRGMKL